MSRRVYGSTAGDVERTVERRRCRQGEHVGAGDVVDVDEVAELAAVLEDLGCPPGLQRAAEEAGDSGVRRVARHPRAVDVVVAEGRDRADAHGRRRRTGAPGGAWSRRTRCADRAARPRGSAADASGWPHAGHPGSKRPAARSAGWRGPGAFVAVAGARVPPFAVHHHAAGQHEPARRTRLVQWPQQRCRADVVVVDVVTDVARSRRRGPPGPPGGRRRRPRRARRGQLCGSRASSQR